MEPFLVCVFAKPSAKEAAEDKGAEIVVPATVVMARDKEHAAMKAYRLVPESFLGKEDRLEVRCLPFGK